jgi:hypothetical protein
MTAACNKFSRICCARVSEYLNSLEADQQTVAPASAAEENASSERIIKDPSADNNTALLAKR